MPKYNATVDGAEIVIELSSVTGKEKIFYEGQVVSEKRSFLYLTVHSFNVITDGKKDVYEVNVITGMGQYGYVIRKNGIVMVHEP